MTNQVQGEILFEGISGGSPVYTPWFPVRSDLATYAAELTAVNGVTLSWNVETRTLDDPAPANYVELFTSAQTISAKGVSSATPTVRAKQLVRYKFWTGGSASITNWAQVRALEPSWQMER